MTEHKNKMPGSQLTKLQYCQRIEWLATKIKQLEVSTRSNALCIYLRGYQSIDDVANYALFPHPRASYFGLEDLHQSIMYPLVKVGICSQFQAFHCPKFWGAMHPSKVLPRLVANKLEEIAKELRDTPDSQLFVEQLDLF